MPNIKCDFGGYATRNDLRCSDGRTIRRNAFKDCDGKTVPLLWNHDHVNQSAVLGHALLENREDGVYAYCTLNDSEQGKLARTYVEHGDVRSLSIYANKLKQAGSDVIHGAIRELSLVLSGANDGAYIDFVMAHGDEAEEEFEANYGEYGITVFHSALAEENDEDEDELSHGESEETVGDVYNTLTDKQKDAVMVIIDQIVNGDDNTDEGENEMKHNLFEGTDNEKNTLSHSEMETIIKDAKSYGSLRESFLAHSDEYGIEDIEFLFPEAHELNNIPEFIKRDTGWVSKVMNKVHKSPFSRIKTRFADITEDEARAKGYIKGKLKKEEVFSLLKRGTTPTTVYKKQKMDRDDVIDITDFDVIAWIKAEMRMMLDEEIARALLIGDGRPASSDDKISELNIRPVVNDEDLFVIRWKVGGNGDNKVKNFIKACIKSRKNYKGSGKPVMYTTEDMLTDMLLLEDNQGHCLYKTEQELATKLRVSEIVTIPLLEGFTDKDDKEVLAIIVNLEDGTLGADKGGAINMFEDFDIDYNQQKYLIETRCSFALTKPFSAIVIRAGESNDTFASEEPTMQEAMAPFKQ